MTDEEAIEIVVSVAFDWCGEYGFSQPEQAQKVWAAARHLRQDLEPPVFA